MYSIFPFPLSSFVIPSVIFIVTLCHTHQRFPTLWPAFILFNLYTTDWPEVFFNLQQHGDQGSFKTYFCFCGGKTVNWEISTKKFPKHPTLLICGPNEWSLLFSNHLFKHSPCLSWAGDKEGRRRGGDAARFLCTYWPLDRLAKQCPCHRLFGKGNGRITDCGASPQLAPIHIWP